MNSVNRSRLAFALTVIFLCGIGYALAANFAQRDGNIANCTTTPAACGALQQFDVIVQGNGAYTATSAITDGGASGTNASVVAGTAAPSQSTNAVVVSALVANAPTTNTSITITTGLTYQTVLAASSNNGRRSLTMQNNQISGTDVCYLLFGSNVASQITPGTTTVSSNLTINSATVPAGGASIILNPGQSYTRYFPLAPSDVLYATCSTTGDSLYVDYQ